ncbi:hypothetical protein SAMN05216420_101354 [Nitrosospira sp. Nl5]|uniref:hypothetical protein n=1 Tax=Nitrosospira sp. Nl5 TaxID=200120 RepID=UPI00088D0A29|nr:hypothetical protein [Nitrosospira sp. Nl5]SCX92640.1 hypothetical protein SAMN05216420_101354 [Nitrosospira sp. Nl5]
MSHWYEKDGSPKYTVIGKNGNERDTTLRDARQLGLAPSVTTVLDVLNKAALVEWKVKQGILAALTLPRASGESDQVFLARVLDDSKQQAIQAAEEGTRIHDAIEASFKGLQVPNDYRDHVSAVRSKLHETFPDVNDWVAETSFASTLGYGGKVDLHSPSHGIVIDHKSKDMAPGDTKKLAYDQDWQLSAYHRGLQLPVNVCANIFVSRTVPGYVEIHVWKSDEIVKAWDVFSCALATWKCIKGYDPSWNELEELCVP